MAVARLALTALDCTEPAPLANFWAALLDGKVIIQNDDLAVVKTDTILIGAVRVPDYTPPTWPGGDTRNTSTWTWQSTTWTRQRRRP